MQLRDILPEHQYCRFFQLVTYLLDVCTVVYVWHMIATWGSSSEILSHALTQHFHENQVIISSIIFMIRRSMAHSVTQHRNMRLPKYSAALSQAIEIENSYRVISVFMITLVLCDSAIYSILPMYLGNWKWWKN